MPRTFWSFWLRSASRGQIFCAIVSHFENGGAVPEADLIVADEEEIVVIPSAQIKSVLKKAQARTDKDATESIEIWESNHRARIDEILRAKALTPRR